MFVIPAAAGLVIPAQAGIQFQQQKNPSAGRRVFGPVALAGFVERPQAVGSNRRWTTFYTSPGGLKSRPAATK
jgi:hypothetical protein